MPELPEIEHLKRSLEPVLIGARVVKVDLQRQDVVRCAIPKTTVRSSLSASARPLPRSRMADQLLAGSVICRLLRHGKNLAIVADTGQALCVHLGMSGQLRFIPAGKQLPDTKHVHCIWHLEYAQRLNSRSKSSDDAPRTTAQLIFRDPRRFGGLWPFPDIDALMHTRWRHLGPDALTIDAKVLTNQLQATRRCIKVALLDQSVLAGVGNIYADEALFRAGIHPLARCDSLGRRELQRLAKAIRDVLAAAVAAGGSTIRDYIDANGRGGQFVRSHHVYGRAGQPCLRCKTILLPLVVAQRSTVFCPKCQPQ